MHVPLYFNLFVKFVVLSFVSCVVAGNSSHAVADKIAASNFTPEFEWSGFHIDVGYSNDMMFVNTSHAQRFVPSIGGKLTKIEVFMDAKNRGEPLHISVWTESAELPDAMLGEKTFDDSEFPSSYFPPNPSVLLDLRSLNIKLTAGQTYLVMYRSDNALLDDWFYTSHVLEPHENSFGLPYLHNNGGGADWTLGNFGLESALQVFVVPEPSAVFGVLISASCISLRRRSRHQTGRL